MPRLRNTVYLEDVKGDFSIHVGVENGVLGDGRGESKEMSKSLYESGTASIPPPWLDSISLATTQSFSCVNIQYWRFIRKE